MRKAVPSGGLVYSTEGGRMCSICRCALSLCECAAASRAFVVGDGHVRVLRESKGRSGKTVTVVRGLPVDASALDALGKQLRSACGAGGTAKDGVLEVQGDHAERVTAWLIQQGWKAKRAGG